MRLFIGGCCCAVRLITEICRAGQWRVMSRYDLIIPALVVQRSGSAARRAAARPAGQVLLGSRPGQPGNTTQSTLHTALFHTPHSTVSHCTLHTALLWLLPKLFIELFCFKIFRKCLGIKVRKAFDLLGRLCWMKKINAEVL